MPQHIAYKGKIFMRRNIPAFISVLLLLAGFSALAAAQGLLPMRADLGFGASGMDGAPSLNIVAGKRVVTTPLPPPVALPRMAPELALQVMANHATIQNAHLGSYSAVSTVTARLPDLKESGQFELDRRYTAPKTLQFTPVRFSGDGFVKANVIVRLLQSEVDHVQKDLPGQTAIDSNNYKFAYKGREILNGRMVHVFHLKPRKKRPGLFKGRIFVDASTGTLVRAEGRMVKSPSLFIKDIDFVQDYADINSFTFPVHMHSQAKARIIGHVIVDVDHRDYRPITDTEQAATAPAGIVSASN
jgi:hypothetical protein